MTASAENDGRRRRIMICAVIAGVSLLLVGAGKISGGMKENTASRQYETRECSGIAESFVSAIPLENREKWLSDSARNPQLFVKVCTAGMNLPSNISGR